MSHIPPVYALIHDILVLEGTSAPDATLIYKINASSKAVSKAKMTFLFIYNIVRNMSIYLAGVCTDKLQLKILFVSTALQLSNTRKPPPSPW